MYKLKKALYGLKQASKEFNMGKVDTTLFIKKIGKDLFVLQIYVDDIILDQPIKTFVKNLGR
jgi:hypothetical protein